MLDRTDNGHEEKSNHTLHKIWTRLDMTDAGDTAGLTQIGPLVPPVPLSHLSARVWAGMLMSARFLFGLSMTITWMVRPSYRWASKQEFHFG